MFNKLIENYKSESLARIDKKIKNIKLSSRCFSKNILPLENFKMYKRFTHLLRRVLSSHNKKSLNVRRHGFRVEKPENFRAEIFVLSSQQGRELFALFSRIFRTHLKLYGVRRQGEESLLKVSQRLFRLFQIFFSQRVFFSSSLLSAEEKTFVSAVSGKLIKIFIYSRFCHKKI